jgi:hypothetical protein
MLYIENWFLALVRLAGNLDVLSLEFSTFILSDLAWIEQPHLLSQYLGSAKADRASENVGKHKL